VMASGRHLLAVLVMASLLWANRAQDGIPPGLDPEEGGFIVPGCGTQKMDLILILDTSENEAAYRALQSFATNFVQFANPDNGLVRVGVVAYSSEVNKRIELTEFSRTVDLVSAISSLRFQPGRRDTAGGLQSMRQLFKPTLGDRPDVPNVALLLTTGNSVLRAGEVSKEARLAHDAGIHVFVVGVGVGNEREINSIVSSPTDETKFVVDDIADLSFLPDVVYSQMCITSNRLDLVFLLHFSNQMTQRSLRQAKSFMKSLVDKADIDSGAVRVGAAVYRRQAFPVFNLKQYASKESLFNGIDGIPLNYKSASASAAAGLDVVRDTMFTMENGERVDVPNAVVVLTDANSDVGVADTISAAQRLRESGASVFAVGVNLNYKDELEAISGGSGGSYVLSSFSELGGVKDEIVGQINALQGQVTNGQLETQKLDVAVAFHVTNNVKLKDVNKRFKPFLENLFETNEIDSGQLIVSLGFFNKNYKLLGNLNKYKTKADYAAGVAKLPKNIRGKKANGGIAMKKIRTKVFKKKLGDRPDAANVVILITDSKTNIKPKTFQEEAETLRDTGAKIVTLGIGKADADELKSVASKPTTDNTIMVASFDDLQKTAVVDLIRTAMFIHTREADVALLVHMSPKLKIKDLNKTLKPFLLRLFQYADIDGDKVRIALGFYRKRLKLIFNLKKIKSRNDYVAALTKLSKKVRGKKANAGFSLKKMRERVFATSRGDRPNVQNVIVLITDDKESEDQKKFIQEAKKTRAGGVKIVTFGIGKADKGELFQAATQPGDKNSLYVPKYSDMNNEDVVDKMRSMIFSMQEDLPAQAPPTTRLPVRPLKSASDSRQLDLAVLFHVSNKAKVADITRGLVPFFQELFRFADIDGGNVRVAMSYYRKNPSLIFNLQKHRTRAAFDRELKANIDKKVRGKKADSGSALEEARTVIFDPSRGDRPDVPNAVLLITDDKTNVDQQKFLQEAQRLKAAGVKVVTLGLSKADRGELSAVASEPAAKNSLYLRDYNGLKDQAFINSVRSTLYASPPPVRPRVDLTASARADLVFAIHFNPQGSQQDWQRLVRWLVSLAQSADIDSGNVRIGLYIDDNYTPFTLDRYTTAEEVTQALNILPKQVARSRRFNMLSTLRTVRERMFQESSGDRPDVPNGLIIITDTNSRDDMSRVAQETSRLAQAGVSVYTVGVGLSDKGEMERVASSPRNVFAVSDYQEMERNVLSLRREIRALDSGAGPGPEQCDPKVDLAFVLDSSTSVTKPNFHLMLEFVKQIVFFADIDTGNVRVAAVVYSSDVYVSFYLKDYSTRQQAFWAVDRIPYRYGSTNTADALQTLRHDVFSPANGDRPDASNIAIIITDGVSNIQPERTAYEARLLRAHGTHVYVIGIGVLEKKELDSIATPPAADNVFSIQTFFGLTESLREKLKLCRQQAGVTGIRGVACLMLPVTVTRVWTVH
ncbi:hypothetical protein BaRGS_00006378, partial [Batillaria attramentaria]